MTRTRYAISLAATSLLVILFRSAAPSGAAERTVSGETPPVLELRLAVAGSSDGALARQAGKFAEAVMAASDGAIVPKLRLLSQPGASSIREFETGNADLAFVGALDIAEAVPSLTLLGQALVFPTERAAYRFFLGKGGERVAAILSGQRRISVHSWLRPVPLILFSAKPMEAKGADSLRGWRLSSRSGRLVSQGLAALGITLTPASADNPLAVLDDASVTAAELSLGDAAGQKIPGRLSHVIELENPLRFRSIAICYSNQIVSNFSLELKDKFLAALEMGRQAAESEAEQDATLAYNELTDGGVTFASFPNSEMLAPAQAAMQNSLTSADKEVRDIIQAALAQHGIPETDFAP